MQARRIIKLKDQELLKITKKQVMKKIWIPVLLISTLLTMNVTAQVYLTRNGKVSFFSQAALENIEAVNIPTEFNGQLRPYQHQGLNWLNFLDNFNFSL